MSISRHQNGCQNQDVKVANRFSESISHLKHLKKTVINQNLTQEEITGRLKSANACYNSVQNRLSYCLLSKNLKARMWKMTPVFLDECETWSLIMREEAQSEAV
jgi:hypothetical protein